MELQEAGVFPRSCALLDHGVGAGVSPEAGVAAGPHGSHFLFWGAAAGMPDGAEWWGNPGKGQKDEEVNGAACCLAHLACLSFGQPPGHCWWQVAKGPSDSASARPVLPACPHPMPATTVPLAGQEQWEWPLTWHPSTLWDLGPRGRQDSSVDAPRESSKTSLKSGASQASAGSWLLPPPSEPGPSRLHQVPGPRAGRTPTWPRGEGGGLVRPSLQEMVNHFHLARREPSASVIRRCLPSCLNGGGAQGGRGDGA